MKIEQFSMFFLQFWLEYTHEMFASYYVQHITAPTLNRQAM